MLAAALKGCNFSYVSRTPLSRVMRKIAGSSLVSNHPYEVDIDVRSTRLVVVDVAPVFSRREINKFIKKVSEIPATYLMTNDNSLVAEGSCCDVKVVVTTSSVKGLDGRDISDRGQEISEEVPGYSGSS